MAKGVCPSPKAPEANHANPGHHPVSGRRDATLAQCGHRGRSPASDATRTYRGAAAAPGRACERTKALGDGVVMRTNGAAAVLVLEKRVLEHVLDDQPGR